VLPSETISMMTGPGETPFSRVGVPLGIGEVPRTVYGELKEEPRAESSCGYDFRRIASPVLSIKQGSDMEDSERVNTLLIEIRRLKDEHRKDSGRLMARIEELKYGNIGRDESLEKIMRLRPGQVDMHPGRPIY